MSRYVLMVALVAMLWATETMAATIGFDGLTGSNLSSFTGSYVEDGFTVRPREGDSSWFVAQVFGNGVPAIGAGAVYSADPGTSGIIVTGGTFTFGGVDLTSNSFGGTSYEIVGSLSGVDKFTFSTTIGDINTFQSIGSLSGDVVDKLTITGTRALGATSFNIDNIRVSAATISGPGSCTGSDPNCPPSTVPEPASILLLGAGLAGLEVWRRRRRAG